MGQIVCYKRANLNALGSIITPPANGEIILVSTNNSMTSDGQGDFDSYIKGDGHTSAVNLPLNKLASGSSDVEDLYIEPNSGTTEKRRIELGTWSTTAYCTFIDISSYVGQSITIVANASNETYYAFTKNTNTSGNGARVTTYATGSVICRIAAGETDINTIPDDAAYLYLQRGTANTEESVDRLPSSVTINGTSINVSGGTVVASRRIAFPKWNGGNSANYRCSMISFPYGGRKVEITANTTNACEYAFMTSSSTSTSGDVATFAKHTAQQTVPAGTTVHIDIPEDATYLYLLKTTTNSDSDESKLPTSIKVLSDVKLNPKNIVYSDNYYTDVTAQQVLEDINKDIHGIEVLDVSTFASQIMLQDGNGLCRIEDSSNYLLSSPVFLYTGDTVNITYNTAVGEGNTISIAQWLGGAINPLVYLSPNASVFSYTAADDIVVILCAKTSVKEITISRINKRLDNIENTEIGFVKSHHEKEYLGQTYTPEYTITKGSYVSYDSSNDVLSISSSIQYNCYTSPIFVKEGNTITLIHKKNYGSGLQIFTLSDENGNLVKPIKALEETKYSNKVYSYRPSEDCYIIVSSLQCHTITITSNSVIQDYMDAFSGVSILDMWANRTTENMLRQLTFGYNGDLNMGLTRVKPLCILHFSDIHNNTVSMHGDVEDGMSNSDRIVKFYNKYKRNGDVGFIDDAIHTGDSVYATAGGNFPWTENEDIAKVLNVIGNHDYDGSINGSTGWPEKYNKFFAPYVEGWGVTLPNDAATDGKCYYYKDYTENKVRLIVLMNWANTSSDYLSNENTWFQSVLEGARTNGFTVVCACHVSPQKLDLIEGCTFNSWECVGHGDAGGNTADRFAQSVDTFIQAGGDFACWICGHTHFDMVGTLHDYNDQLVIIVENASCWSKWNTDRRVTGTLSQDCFNVMSIDTTLKRVNVMRIGSNFASAMQHKGAFSYDYKQKKLLNCW